jgi:DNA-binding transcriptional ArsR family regulator
MTRPQHPSRKTVPRHARRAQAASGSDAAESAADEPVARSRPHRQVITDARAMRALAHPLRVELLEAVRRDGEITATRAAELLGESPGNMSWHLQTLARYGFVEESGKGRGRSRPWRLTSGSRSFETDMTDPETAAAGEALERTILERAHTQIREWWTRRRAYPVKWQRAAFMTDTVRYLTAPELAAAMEEIIAICDRYADREDKAKRPAGALPVLLHAHGHPLPPTLSGN